jgi:hypothetical protein
MVPPLGGSATWLPAIQVPVSPQKTEIVPELGLVSAFTELPV